MFIQNTTAGHGADQSCPWQGSRVRGGANLPQGHAPCGVSSSFPQTPAAWRLQHLPMVPQKKACQPEFNPHSPHGWRTELIPQVSFWPTHTNTHTYTMQWKNALVNKRVLTVVRMSSFLLLSKGLLRLCELEVIRVTFQNLFIWVPLYSKTS